MSTRANDIAPTAQRRRMAAGGYARLLLFLIAAVVGCRGQQPAGNGPEPQPRPELDYALLTEGIVGGIVPPHVRQQTIVVRRDNGYEVYLLEQPERTSEARYWQGKMSDQVAENLLGEIQQQRLWQLPVESPLGSEDIYGLDTSIAVKVGERFWRNGGPAGCIHGESTTQATEGQREQFQELVQLIEETGAQNAVEPGDAVTFNAVLDEIQRSGPYAGEPGGQEIPAEPAGEWQPAERAFYKAHQIDDLVLIMAYGVHRTAGYQIELRQLPIEIYPPQFELMQQKPTGFVAQVLTPFVTHAHFGSGGPVKTLVVRDAAGEHSVPVESTETAQQQ